MNVMQSFSLNKKVAAVTGGAGKYGRFLVEALAEAGAVVYIADFLTGEKLQPLLDGFRSRGLDVRSKFVNLGEEESMKALVWRTTPLRSHAVTRSPKRPFRSMESWKKWQHCSKRFRRTCCRKHLISVLPIHAK